MLLTSGAPRVWEHDDVGQVLKEEELESTMEVTMLDPKANKVIKTTDYNFASDNYYSRSSVASRKLSLYSESVPLL